MSPRIVVRTLAATAAMVTLLGIVRAEDSPSEQLQSLLEDSWEYGMAEDPLFATHAGDNRYNDRLPRETLADQARRGRHAAASSSSGWKRSRATSSRATSR